MWVNGAQPALEVAPDRWLLDVLRDDLGLRGTKPGCRAGACGACHVLLDGRSVAACETPVWQAQGRRVTTVEALPAVLAEAFFHEQAAQCGYCSAGMLVATAALLRERPDPTRAEIDAALERHLCRCGAHPRIVRAVQRAAAALRAGVAGLAGVDGVSGDVPALPPPGSSPAA